MDLFSFEGARRIGPENVLMKVSALVDWRRMGTVLDRAKLRSGLGAQGYDLLLLFKCLLLGQWELCWKMGDATGSGGAGFGGVDDGDTVGELARIIHQRA